MGQTSIEEIERKLELLQQEVKSLKQNSVRRFEVEDWFEDTNNFEKEHERMKFKQDEMKKAVVDVDSFAKDLYKILKDQVGLLLNKMKSDEEKVKENNSEYEKKLNLLTNFLTDSIGNIQTVFDEVNEKIRQMMSEMLEFEEHFVKNFSCLTHNNPQESPGYSLYQDSKPFSSFGRIFSPFSRDENERKQIKIKFKSSEEISERRERCGRILTVGGSYPSNIPEVTILIVGVTGAGKSTLIDAIANFYYNVRYEDPYRLQLVDLLDEEKKKTKNQALSQTDEVTVYRLPHLPNGNAPQLRLTIIDTPGVADTRGIEQDKKLVDKLMALFDKGKIPKLTSICFVSNAGSPRLTASQKYSFESLITNFGKDFINNILGLFTFDDGGFPKALDAFQAANIGLSAWFKFNSRAMLEERVRTERVTKTIMMTEEARTCVQVQQFYRNCDKFFGTLLNMTGVTTKKTAHVMKERKELEEKRYQLNFKLTNLLNKKEEVRQEEDILQKYKNDKNVNKDFKHVVDCVDIDIVHTNPGKFVTNCTVCHGIPSCHDDCVYEKDGDKKHCSAMDNNGDCMHCKCHWSKHTNMKYKLVATKVKKKVSVRELEEKYNAAVKNCDDQTDVLQKVKEKQDQLSKEFQATIEDVRDCIIRLDEIAMKTGFEDRIKELEEEKKRAKLRKLRNDFV